MKLRLLEKLGWEPIHNQGQLVDYELLITDITLQHSLDGQTWTDVEVVKVEPPPKPEIPNMRVYKLNDSKNLATVLEILSGTISGRTSSTKPDLGSSDEYTDIDRAYLGSRLKSKTGCNCPVFEDYIHLTCKSPNRLTEEAAQEFVHRAHPYLYLLCSHCDDAFPLEQFKWAETGKIIGEHLD